MSLITHAFEHLKAEKKEKPALKIYLWDSASTGMELPLVPWDVRDCINRNQPWRFRDKQFDILFQPENNTLNIMDKRHKTACFWIRDFQNLPQYEIGSPLLATLHWWFSRCDFYMLQEPGVYSQVRENCLYQGGWEAGIRT